MKKKTKNNLIIGLIVYMILFMFLIVLTSTKAQAKRLNSNKVIEICKMYKSKDEFKSFGEDCTLLSAIAKIESAYKTSAYNPEKTGSHGLMQLQCSTAKMVGLKFHCDQLFSPYINIRFAMKYMIRLRKDPEVNTVEDLIAAWNAGTAITCKSYNRGKCYPGEYINEEYVWKVYRHYRYLKGQKKYLRGETYEMVRHLRRRGQKRVHVRVEVVPAVGEYVKEESLPSIQ